ncbi:MAG: hypothetical protein OEZ58_21185 [Gammaproteobacteria bacterium]|nr:hypothetical protein [Gammaproteobacteria bacterium]
MKHFKSILAMWGVISGLLVLVALVFFAYQFYFGNKVKINKATTNDVRFVLNWPGLGEKKIQSVLNSYESARSLTGDHLDAYEIQTSGISIEELQDTNTWTRGDKLNGILKEGVDLVNIFIHSDKFPWFPDEKTILSNQIYIYSWSILFHNKRAASAKIIFVKPSENKVYYASVKS